MAEKNVRMAWFTVKVCLLANYFGQAAYLLSTNYSSEKNPFFAIVPDNFYSISSNISDTNRNNSEPKFNYRIIYIDIRSDKIKSIPEINNKISNRIKRASIRFCG